VALALQANVKQLLMFHHDPDNDDKKIDGFVKHARQLVRRRNQIESGRRERGDGDVSAGGELK